MEEWKGKHFAGKWSRGAISNIHKPGCPWPPAARATRVWPLAPMVSPILEMDTLHHPPRSPPGAGSSSDENTVGLVLAPGVGCGEGISVLPYLQAAPQLLQAMVAPGQHGSDHRHREPEPTFPVQLLRLLSGWLLKAKTQWINTFMFPNWKFVQSAWMKEMFLL